VLVAVAPIAGTPRIVSAAVNITKALGFAVGVEFGEAESDAGLGVEPDPGHTAGPSV